MGIEALAFTRFVTTLLWSAVLPWHCCSFSDGHWKTFRDTG